MREKRRKATTPASDPVPTEAGELPERWSTQRKTELVLRLLRGEALDAMSRESQVPAHELESWKRVFLGVTLHNPTFQGICAVAMECLTRMHYRCCLSLATSFSPRLPFLRTMA